MPRTRPPSPCSLDYQNRKEAGRAARATSCSRAADIPQARRWTHVGAAKLNRGENDRGFANNDVPVFERALILVLPYTTHRPRLKLSMPLTSWCHLAPRSIAPNPGRLHGRPVPTDGQQVSNELATAIAALIDSIFPEEALSDEHREVCSELLRGLASHTKMGENNHSHEDDLWKTRGQGLGSSERKMIVERLLKAGILGRKKNNSMGGTGWFIGSATCKSFVGTIPSLNRIFSSGRIGKRESNNVTISNSRRPAAGQHSDSHG